ncbi:hypothetical protein FA95DRAFT_1607643 [Auriscalpium vulgare]|uniref:Uncharacterized protein n=1 Tax=Auriscalpium vulgare TaxID=40419 RepID=A0ACB8RPV3_9AGAM|nr:hypothetical protein FA95DRAFT_1607643 [Auriscalpium vulgare]
MSVLFLDNVPPRDVHSIPPNQPGGILIGCVVAAVLYGFTSQQMVFYFSHFPQDGIALKIWAAMVWVFDTLATILTVLVAYDYFILRYGEAIRRPLDNWWFSIAGVATGATICLVHGFFIFRIRKLRKTVYPGSPLNHIIFVFFSIMALFCFASSIQLTYYDFRDPQSYYRRPMFISNVSVQTALDLFITIALVTMLQFHRNEFTAKSSPIEQLTFFFLTRGVVLTYVFSTNLPSPSHLDVEGNSVFQVLLVAVPYAVPGSLAPFALFACVSNVYANSALVTLNNRDRIMRGDGTTHSSLFHHSSMQFAIPDLPLTSFETEGLHSTQRPQNDRHLDHLELRTTSRPGSVSPEAPTVTAKRLHTDGHGGV